MSSVPSTLVLLPGALGAMEGTRRIGEGLAGSRPIATIDYRPGDRLPALFARIEAAGGAGPFDLLGQSYGGWIAQCFATAHPARVRRLVLSHSFVLRRGHARGLDAAAWLLRRTPRRLTRALLLRRIGRAMAPVRTARPDVYARRLASLEQAFDAGLIDVFAAQARCMADGCRPGPGAAAPAIPTLVIDSDNDPIVRERSRAALRATHGHARLHRFQGTGHSSASLATDDFVALVRAFLDEAP